MPLTSYTTFDGSNIGGIACDSITLVALEDIYTQTATEVAYLQATKIYFTEDTALHTEAQKNNAQGELFEQQIGFNIPKNRTEIRAWLTANHRRYFFLQYIDKNGFAIELPIMRLLARYSTGEQARSMNGFEFRLQGNTISPAREARTLFNPPIMSISPTSLAYGTVKTGTTKTAIFTVNNIGEQPLTISSLSLPTGYTTSALPAPIPAGGSHTFTITFAPTLGVTYAGTITVNSNAVSSENTVGVTGLGFVEVGFRLNGTSNFATAPFSAGNTFAHTQAFTYSYYIRTGATVSGTRILQERQDVNNSQTIALNAFGMTNGALAFFKGNAGSFQGIQTTTNVLVPNTLYKIDVVNTDGTAAGMKIYINNILQTTSIFVNNTVVGTPSTGQRFGSRAGELHFAGSIFYIRAYDKALTLAEIEEQDSLTIPATAVANLKAHYNIQELQGSATLEEIINNNDATLGGYTLSDLNNSRVDENNNII
jgi:hypothetical protein